MTGACDSSARDRAEIEAHQMQCCHFVQDGFRAFELFFLFFFLSLSPLLTPDGGDSLRPMKWASDTARAERGRREREREGEGEAGVRWRSLVPGGGGGVGRAVARRPCRQFNPG